MSAFQNCPFCGGYLNCYDDVPPDECNSCHKSLALLKNIPVVGGVIGDGDLRDISSAIYAQADSATRMVAALVSAQALPLVSLLESWWDKLNETDRNSFVKALLVRAITILCRGDLDHHIATVAGDAINWGDANKFRERLDALDKGNALAEAVAGRIAKGLDDEKFEMNAEIKEVVAAHVRALTESHMRDQREVVEAAVRDRMPDIEKLTERVVREVTEDATKEIRERMQRNDDKDGGAYR
jgi:hypothetical protein